jgi:hypothetical protein
VAAVAAENSPMPGDIFVFYEYVAEAVEVEDDMAKALIEDLAVLCAHLPLKEAAQLVRQSYKADVSEAAAWKMRAQAGRLIPFKLFNGSHEATSEARTLQKWGLPIRKGLAGKTEGLPQLRFYLKPEQKPHPFKPGVVGRPNIYLVVADDQALAGVDRWGLARHRWEAANLQNDPNITTRDVPTKFGDDCTDAVKHYLQTFALTAAPRTINEQIQAQLPEAWRDEQIAKLDSATAQRYEDARREELQEIKRSLMKKRRPDYYGLGDDDFGTIDDCF